MEKIKQILERYPQARVLDLGTGVGNFISLLVSITNDFHEIIGVDTSEKILERAKTNFATYPFVRFEVGDANHLPYGDGTFDIICLSNSLHHLEQVTATFKEMKRLLRPGGCIIINEMIKDGLDNAQKSHMMLHHFAAEIDRRMHILHNDTYTKKEIIELLTNVNGLETENYWEVKFPKIEQPMEKDIKGLLALVDRITAQTYNFDDKEYFINKGEEIKSYIKKNSYASAPQYVFVLHHI